MCREESISLFPLPSSSAHNGAARLEARRQTGAAAPRGQCCGDVVGTLVFRDGVMDRIRLRETRFHEHAYVFVLLALEFLQSRLPERRHVDGRELAHALRELALEQYGVMSRLVLEHWGVRSTADVGDIVFTLVDTGLLMSQPTDRRLDFVDVYTFDEAFEASYPWSAAHLA
jgi:uncharacterized repeat protein (TIGR04138 family)